VILLVLCKLVCGESTLLLRVVMEVKSGFDSDRVWEKGNDVVDLGDDSVVDAAMLVEV
jgi:hypothetical protein